MPMLPEETSVVQVIDPDGDLVLPGPPSASDNGVIAMNNLNATTVNISVTPSSTAPGLDPLKDRDPPSSLASPPSQSLSTPLAFPPPNHTNLKTPSYPVSLPGGDLISVSSQNLAATPAAIPVPVSKAGAHLLPSSAACAVLTPTFKQQCALKRAPTAAISASTRTHRASPSNSSTLTIASSTAIQSSSDSDFGSASASASASDRDDHDANGNGTGDACVNAGGKKLKRPRKDRLAGAGESDDNDDDRVGAKDSRSRRSSRVSDGSDDRRLVKKARMHVEEADADANVRDESETPSDGGRRQEGARSSSNLRTPARARTETPERERSQDKSPSPSGSRMSWSLPPPSRPAPSRFHSWGSSCSTVSSGPPLPTTPPSPGAASGPTSGSTSASCSFSTSHNSIPGSGPQPFWFDDGDLVLFVSPPVNAAVASAGSQCLHPLLSMSVYPAASTANVVYANHDVAPTSSSSLPSFRIHAARLVQTSSAFAALLTSPFPDNPLEEDSARAAREIAQRLRVHTTSRRGSGASEVKFGEASFFKSDEGEYEVFGGCPAVRLESDAYRDWLVAFEAMYEPMSFQVRPVVFDVLASALRIATRYGMRQLSEWAVAQLRTTWPSHVEWMPPVALPNAADAIALARECGVPEILPAAFYALAIQRWRPRSVYTHTSSSRGSVGVPGLSRAEVETCGTDGGRAHAVLDPMDLRRLVMGREALQDVLVEIVANPLTLGRSMLSEDEFAAAAVASNASFGEEKTSKSHGIDGMYRPPSPSPSRSPSPKMPTLLAVPVPVAPGLVSSAPSPALSNVSARTEATMVSVSESTSAPAFQRHQSFSASSASSPGFPSSSPSTTTTPANLSASGASTFSFCSPSASGCRAMLETLWRKRLTPDGRRAWGTWLVRELYRLASLPRAQMNYELTGVPGGSLNGAGEVKKENENGQAGREEVCLRCWEENRRLALWRLDWLCAAIPGMFML